MQRREMFSTLMSLRDFANRDCEKVLNNFVNVDPSDGARHRDPSRDDPSSIYSSLSIILRHPATATLPITGACRNSVVSSHAIWIPTYQWQYEAHAAYVQSICLQ